MTQLKDQRKSVTPMYAVVTACFWASFCVCVSYAGEYLSKQLGYTASEYGPIMAVGSLLGAIIAPFIGTVSDKYRRLTPLKLALPLFAAQILCLAVILIYSGAGKCFANTAAFTLFIAVSIPVNTVNLKMDVDLERAGGRLNYPLARGCGSLGFVVISTVLGLMMDAPQFGYISVPVGGLILILCEIPVHLWADRRLKALRAAGGKGVGADVESAVESASSLPAFAKQNGRFCLMLLGTVLIFVAHNLDCNFLTEINNALGGDSTSMGLLSAFTAVVEVPVMIFFIPVFGKMRESTLIRFSLAMFVVKILAYALAPSIPVLFAARLLQAPSYALYTAAIVPYVSKVIAPRDANKGQSLAFTMTTVGSIVANICGGVMYDNLGKTYTLLIGAGICLVGAVLAILGTQTVSDNR